MLLLCALESHMPEEQRCQQSKATSDQPPALSAVNCHMGHFSVIASPHICNKMYSGLVSQEAVY